LSGMFILLAICLVAHSCGFLISSTRGGGSALANSSAAIWALTRSGRAHEVRSFCERLHAPSQIASYVIKSDTAQAQGGFQFASRLGNDHDWLGAIEHSSGPGCVLATQSNVDASGEVPLGVFGRINARRGSGRRRLPAGSLRRTRRDEELSSRFLSSVARSPE
jgi:hypothetical protein